MSFKTICSDLGFVLNTFSRTDSLKGAALTDVHLYKTSLKKGCPYEIHSVTTSTKPFSYEFMTFIQI